MPDREALTRGSYLRRVVAWALGVEPCPCGCNLIQVRRMRRPGEIMGHRRSVDWSELGRVRRWATKAGPNDG